MYSDADSDDMYHSNIIRSDKVMFQRRDGRHFLSSSQAQHLDTRESIESDEKALGNEEAMGDGLDSTEERLHEKVVRLFNISDFLYSFFFGLLPSLMDITTDFSFADRLR